LPPKLEKISRNYTKKTKNFKNSGKKKRIFSLKKTLAVSVGMVAQITTTGQIGQSNQTYSNPYDKTMCSAGG
jgi:hypothetical protein